MTRVALSSIILFKLVLQCDRILCQRAIAFLGTRYYLNLLSQVDVVARSLTQSTLAELLDSDSGNDPSVYFPYLGANRDGFDHIRSLGDNVFGFEDLPNGGDRDYNDMLIQVEIA
ncbi:DUF4114 domain-containing protein [Coleofasciculus sp.]|uniref:DUF4114 domain-containing protein n=1 Tax=Coleofasciculus sp. TaxID=3100458 RepID=UPI003A44AB5F